MNVLMCMQRCSSSQRCWNSLIRYSMSHKTFIYSMRFMAFPITNTHVPKEPNQRWFLTSQPHLWDIKNNYLLLDTWNNYRSKTMAVPMYPLDSRRNTGVFWSWFWHFSHVKRNIVPLLWLRTCPLLGVSWKPLPTKSSLFHNIILVQETVCWLNLGQMAKFWYWVWQISFFFSHLN